jgi:hypothetical protein
MAGSSSGTGADKDKPTGPPPQADRDLNGPGMTNGIPDANSEGDSAARPTSDREKGENAGKNG